MAIFGQLAALSKSSSLVVLGHGSSTKQRQKTHCHYLHHGQSICPIMFQFFHTIGKTRLDNLIASYNSHGLCLWIHGNTERLPSNALSLSSIGYVTKFPLTYADQNAILIPGRMPGNHKTDIKLLPSSVSKRSIWKLYSESAASVSHIHSVAYSTFNKLWESLIPSIVLMKLMSDLCWTCQQNSTAILRAANHPDSDKSAVIEEAQEHLIKVQLERSFCKTTLFSYIYFLAIALLS